MAKLKPEGLHPGMIVAVDVKTADDMLLIPKGCALTEKQIDMLSTWGIVEVHIQSDDGSATSGDPLDALTPEARRKLTVELAGAYWVPPDANPVQKQIFELALRRKARQLLGS